MILKKFIEFLFNLIKNYIIMNNKSYVSEKDLLLKEIENGKREMIIAQQQFNNAEEDFIDVAIKGMEYFTERYNALIVRYKNIYG